MGKTVPVIAITHKKKNSQRGPTVGKVERIKMIRPPQPRMKRNNAAGRKLATRGDEFELIIDNSITGDKLYKKRQWVFAYPLACIFSLTTMEQRNPSSSLMIPIYKKNLPDLANHLKHRWQNKTSESIKKTAIYRQFSHFFDIYAIYRGKNKCSPIIRVVQEAGFQ